MKKLNLTNLYESHFPPTRTDVLWVDINERTGDIRAIHRFKNGKWEPYMVSVDYMSPSDTEGEVTIPMGIKLVNQSVGGGESVLQFGGTIFFNKEDIKKYNLATKYADKITVSSNNSDTFYISVNGTQVTQIQLSESDKLGASGVYVPDGTITSITPFGLDLTPDGDDYNWIKYDYSLVLVTNITLNV